MWSRRPKLDPRLGPQRWIVTGLTQRSNRRLWESVSVCWTTMEWPRLGLGIRREKNENGIWDLGFGIISSRYSRRHTHLRVRHLYLLRPGSLVCCLSCGTVVAVSVFVVVCLFKSQKNLGVSLPAFARALLGTIIWFIGFLCDSTNHHKDNNKHNITHQNLHEYGIMWSYLIHCFTHSLITQLHLDLWKRKTQIKSLPLGSRQFLDFLGNIFMPCSSPRLLHPSHPPSLLTTSTSRTGNSSKDSLQK